MLDTETESGKEIFKEENRNGPTRRHATGAKESAGRHLSVHDLVNINAKNAKLRAKLHFFPCE